MGDRDGSISSDELGKLLYEQVNNRMRKNDQTHLTYHNDKHCLWPPGRVYEQAVKLVEDQLHEFWLDPFLDGENKVDTLKFIDFLMSKGIRLYNDIRLKEFLDCLAGKKRPGKYDRLHDRIREFINKDEFYDLVKQTPLVRKVIRGNLIVNDFEVFRSEFNEVFDECKSDSSGDITTYIPGLTSYDNNKWAASLCTIDGQIHNVGDYEDLFTIQSTTKPIFYGIASDIIGADVIHQHVGKEPSGFGFNKIQVGHGGLPHNPLINTGAITIASLLLPEKPMSERFSYIMSKYECLAEGSTRNVTFNNSVYLSEKHNGHRNYAIGYYLKGKGCLGAECNLTDTLELYFQLCSIETDTTAMSVIAAALANGGRNVFTGAQVISEEVIQNMLALMFSCGMYDYSGEWAFEIGLPAKSGVSGVILVVIPNVGGIAMWSPLLDKYGNSVRGVKFTKNLIKRYTTNRKQNIMHPFSNKKCLLSTLEEMPQFNRGMVSAILHQTTRHYHTSTNHSTLYRSHVAKSTNHSTLYRSHVTKTTNHSTVITSCFKYMNGAFRQLKQFVK